MVKGLEFKGLAFLSKANSPKSCGASSTYLVQKVKGFVGVSG